MEIYILDSLLRPIDVIDEFESMIWTERFSDIGDFELLLIFTASNRKRFVTETWLSITESKRVMKVKTVEDTLDDEGRKMLKVRGREISSVFEERLALGVDGTDIMPSWVITAMTPGGVMRHMFNSICVDGDVNPNDVIPLFTPGGTLYPPDTIEEPADLIDWEQKPSSLYSALRELSGIYDLGFRLYRDPTTSHLFFNVYSGSDRTTSQTELPPVVFSADLENVLNTTEITTTGGAYNVAFVIWVETIPESESGGVITPEQIIVHKEVVYADADAPAAEGFERQVLLVEITSIPEEVVDIPAYLQRSGLDALMLARPIKAFDGELSQHSQYKYERDYFLGDLVEQRTLDGSTSRMRVAEQIFVQDSEGQRDYPTLLMQSFVHPGTWLSWKYNKDWIEMGADEYWIDQE